MKWTIKKIESKLQKQLKRNYLSFGLDIALKVTGYAILKTTNTELILVDKGIIDTSKFNIITDRLNYIEKSIKNIIIPNIKDRVGVIEKPYIGINRNTAIVLAKSAGVAYSVLRKKFPYTFFLSAVSARARIGFHSKKRTKEEIKAKIKKPNTKKLLQEFIKEKFNFVEDNNIVDGFVLSIAGLIV